MSPGKTDDFIAVGFTTQSGGEGKGKAQVSETTMLTFVIVFPESSDKDGLYCHVAGYYSAGGAVKSRALHPPRCNPREIFPTGISRSITGYNKSRRCRV